MNGGLPRRNNRGFTIIEVMIVLAVSGFMLISALYVLNGKQKITAFNQSVRNAQTQLQQVLNEVGSGYYTSTGSIACGKNGPGGGPLLTTATTEQGTNENCIFLGKVIQYAVDATDPEGFNVYTVVGLRGDSVNPSLDLASSKARLIARGTSALDAAVPDVYDARKQQYGLTVSKMYYNNDATKTIGAVGFTSSLGSLGDSDGSQQVNTIAVTGTTLKAAKATAVAQINTNLAAAVVNPANGVQICLNSGGTTQSGLLSVGGSGRQGVVSLKIYYKLDCL